MMDYCTGMFRFWTRHCVALIIGEKDRSGGGGGVGTIIICLHFYMMFQHTSVWRLLLYSTVQYY